MYMYVYLNINANTWEFKLAGKTNGWDFDMHACISLMHPQLLSHNLVSTIYFRLSTKINFYSNINHHQQKKSMMNI